MTGLIILAILLILWGVLSLAIALIKPATIWSLGKIQGFVKLLGDKGARIFLSILGIAAIFAGSLLLKMQL